MNDTPSWVLWTGQKLKYFSTENDIHPLDTSPSPSQASDSLIRNDSSDAWGFGASSLPEG